MNIYIINIFLCSNMDNKNINVNSLEEMSNSNLKFNYKFMEYKDNYYSKSVIKLQYIIIIILFIMHDFFTYCYINTIGNISTLYILPNIKIYELIYPIALLVFYSMLFKSSYKDIFIINILLFLLFFMNLLIYINVNIYIFSMFYSKYIIIYFIRAVMFTIFINSFFNNIAKYFHPMFIGNKIRLEKIINITEPTDDNSKLI